MPKFRLPLWAQIWLALVLLAGVVFFANTQAVERLMDSTGLTTLLYPQGRALVPQVVHPAPVDSQAVVIPDTEPVALENTAESSEASPVAGNSAPTNIAPGATEVPPGTTLGPNTYHLYFSRLGPDGRMETAPFARELPAGSTPLTATLKALLLGPTLQEKEQGALTMLPSTTKLLSVRLNDKIALLSFSEDFAHNTLGNEGLVGQLKQVVWTATQFATVDSVQILITGQYRDTLGEEGLSIARPLNRANLP
ncbi:MAG: GerMN domain-containing protein [Spirochaetales bacterium]